MPTKVNRTLPNGAIVISEGRNLAGENVAYCRFQEKYVTWMIDETDDAFYGHYFDVKEDAEKDYFERRGLTQR